MPLQTKLQPTVQQRLVMTPLLQQAVALLQKSRAELIETVREALVENPVLDADESGVIFPREEEGAALPFEAGAVKENLDDDHAAFDSYLRESARGVREPTSFSAPAEAPSYEEFIGAEPTLEDHLTWQLEVSPAPPDVREMCRILIGHVNEQGYLAVPLEEIAALAVADMRVAEEALRLLQGMDPLGVGARDVRECFLLQIEGLGLGGRLVETIVRKHLPLIETKRLADIARAEGVSEADVAEACEELRHLHPKPGLQFSPSRNVAVVPDVYVHRVDGDYKIVLNEDGLPKLRVSRTYEHLMRNAADQVEAYLHDKIRQAEWLIKNIYQRQRTIQRVVEAIVRRQRAFFEHGPTFLAPMTLKDVADDVGLHPSTVSRVVREKYAHTPRGLFELKFFFHAPIASQDGSDSHSSVQIKEALKEILAEENPARPLSDARLAEILAQRGMRVARRTVAKYREELGIASSSARKRR